MNGLVTNCPLTLVTKLSTLFHLQAEGRSVVKNIVFENADASILRLNFFARKKLLNNTLQIEKN